MRRPARPKLVLARLRPGVSEIRAKRVVEHVRGLGDVADRGAQRFLCQVLDVGVGYRDCSGRGVVEPSNQVGHRRLAAAGTADERHRLAGSNAEGTSCSSSPLGR